MKSRIPMNPARFGDAFNAMLGLGAAVEKSGLEGRLIDLVKVRASQINGCGYCIDMHTKDARLDGETEQRLYLLDAWREAPMYSARERAALAWTEAVTRLEDHDVADAGLRAGARTVQRRGARVSDAGGGSDQRLESLQHCVPDDGRLV